MSIIEVHKYNEKHEIAIGKIKKSLGQDSLESKQINICSSSNEEPDENSVLQGCNDVGHPLIIGVTQFEPKQIVESTREIVNELTVKHSYLSGRAQLFADRKKLTNDRIAMVNNELIKLKNKLNSMCDPETAKFSANGIETVTRKTDEIESRIDKVMSELHFVRAVVDNSYEKQKELNDVMKTFNCSVLTKIKSNCIGKLNDIKIIRDELQTSIKLKDEEIATLETLVSNQNTYIDSYKKSLRHFDDHEDSDCPKQDKSTSSI